MPKKSTVTKKSTPKKVAVTKKTPKKTPLVAEEVLKHAAQTMAARGDLSGLQTLRESMQTLGFAIGDPNEKAKQKFKSFSLPESDDGAIVSTIGGAYGSYIDIEGVAKNEFELISRYREMSLQPEVDYAIQDIVNEAIINEDNNEPIVTLELDTLDGYSDEFKESIIAEFRKIIRLLNFKRKGQQIFKRWYIDGRLYYHIMIDEDNPRMGIQEVRYIDPRTIRKIREIRTKRIQTGAEVIDVVAEYYIYNPRGIHQSDAINGLKISPDSIAYCNSGLVSGSGNNSLVLSYLHKAIKPLNQLRYIEDATVIYRLSRAPERRIFYIDVGSMPAPKAQQYLNNIMNTYRNKLVYDSNTGEIRDDKKFLSMMEDYWIPRREGGKSTEIDTLKGGENLGKMEDVEYFEKKLYQSLNVPFSRFSGDSGFNMGRASEINRDEEKYYKFVISLRQSFQNIFLSLLKTQLLLKGRIAEEDWPEIEDACYFNFAKNSFYIEASQLELLNNRLAALGQVSQMLGSFFSYEWAYKNIMKFSDEEIRLLQKQISKETPRPTYDMETQTDTQLNLITKQADIELNNQLKATEAELKLQAQLAPKTGE